MTRTPSSCMSRKKSRAIAAPVSQSSGYGAPAQRYKWLILMSFTLICLAWIMTMSPARAEEAPEAPLEIVALGDSLTAGYMLPPGAGFAEQLEKALKNEGYKVNVVNAGVSGDTSSGGLARLDWALSEDTDAVILELGANDALRGIPPEITERNLGTIITKLKERGITVLLAGMLAPPNMGQDYETVFNAVYPSLAEKHDLVLYPFFLDGVAAEPDLNLGDGMHPNEEGVKVMVDRILPSVEEMIARAKNGAKTGG